MSVKLLTPRMGEGIEQVTVLTWLKKKVTRLRNMNRWLRWKRIKSSPKFPARLKVFC